MLFDPSDVTDLELWHHWRRILLETAVIVSFFLLNELFYKVLGLRKQLQAQLFSFFLLFFLFYSVLIFEHSLHLCITSDFKTFCRSHIFLFTEILLNELHWHWLCSIEPICKNQERYEIVLKCCASNDQFQDYYCYDDFRDRPFYCIWNSYQSEMASPDII